MGCGTLSAVYVICIFSFCGFSQKNNAGQRMAQPTADSAVVNKSYLMVTHINSLIGPCKWNFYKTKQYGQQKNGFSFTSRCGQHQEHVCCNIFNRAVHRCFCNRICQRAHKRKYSIPLSQIVYFLLAILIAKKWLFLVQAALGESMLPRKMKFMLHF